MSYFRLHFSKVFKKYTTLLPDQAHDWGFHLVTMYMNALSHDIQLKIGAPGYRVSNISGIDTVNKQHSTLSLLRENTVRCHADRILAMLLPLQTQSFVNYRKLTYCLQAPLTVKITYP